MKAKPKTGTWAQIVYFILEVTTEPQSEVAESHTWIEKMLIKCMLMSS